PILLLMNWNKTTFPSLKRRGGCGINQKCEATESRRRGARFGEVFRPEQFRRTDHPGRAVSERIHFIDSAATPPFQGGECRALQFVHSFIERRYSWSRETPHSRPSVEA